MATEAQIFNYERPEIEKGKTHVRLAGSDLLRGEIQVIKDGGETNLHSHPATDGFWMVLGGKARFYGEGDTLLAELGRNQGIMIPRGLPYWFDRTGDEPLEILHMSASLATKSGEDRVNYAERTRLEAGFIDASHAVAGSKA